MKTSNPLFHNKGFKFPAHSQDKSVYFLILGNTLKGEKMHINITKHFFLGFIKPHNPVSKDTFLKWLKKLLLEAVVNLTVFSPHSVESAPTSYANSHAQTEPF